MVSLAIQPSLANRTSPRSRGASWCSAKGLNTLLGVDATEESDLPLFRCVQVRSGQSLIRAGQVFTTLFVVKAGFFKTVFTDETGNEQVLGFPVKSELLGTDGLGDHAHVNEVVALTAADVVEIPFTCLGTLASMQAGLDETLLRTVSRQLVHEQLALTMIGAMRADSRMAGFLLGIGQKMNAMGYSSVEFNLQMNRQAIGSYLGMKIETVSRTLTGMARSGLIELHQRQVRILKPDGLRELYRQGPLKKSNITRDDSAAQTQPSVPHQSAQTPWSGLVTGLSGPLRRP